MEAKTYNGWTNYETWAVALWLDNEEPSYRLTRDLTQTVWREAPQSQAVREWGWSRVEAAEHRLAELLREFIEGHNPTPPTTLFADLMWAALGEVNWQELASHYLADIAEEHEKETTEKDNEQHMEEKQTK